MVSEHDEDISAEVPDEVQEILADTELGQFLMQPNRAEEDLVDELPSDAYCPDDRRTCAGYLTPGASEPIRCPLDAQGECPHAEERRRYQQQRRLTAAGFGKRYVRCEYTWDRVYEPVRPMIRDYCDQIEQMLDQGEGLTLCGPTEAGKTCCLGLIALAAPAGCTVRYITVRELYSLVHSDRQQAEKIAKGADLLLLDEVGAAYSDQHRQAFLALGGYLSFRHADLRPTCISTNMRWDTLVSYMMAESSGEAERILSRLEETNTKLSFAGAPKQRQEETPGPG